MRTTLNSDEALLKRAARLTGIQEKTALARLGLLALIAKSLAMAPRCGTTTSLAIAPR